MSLLDTASLVLTPNAYKEGKLYSVIPSDGSGDFTATRATTATRVNADGLVDLVPYNLMTYSEQFDNAAWAKVNSTISANTTTAPNGTITADSLIDNSTNSIHVVNNSGGGLGVFTFSFYAKANTLTRVGLLTAAAVNTTLASTAQVFDLSNGTVVNTISGVTATITNVGDGWYRCSATLTALASGSYFITCIKTGTNIVYIGSGESLYLWGAQLVEGASARDYLRTETRLNIPRVDYSLGGCPNILLEPQRTNLALQSSSFDSASWPKTALTVAANSVISPSGIQDADTLTADGTLSFHSVVSSSISVTSTPQTASIYVKKNTNNFIQIAVTAGIGGMYANFDIANGVVGSVGTTTGSNPTSSIQSVGDGWYRCSMTYTPTASGNTNVYFAIAASTTDTRLLANAISTSVFLWGAQLEAGAYATSYIPTTIASVTRNADLISRNNIYTNGLITAAGGTWFVELRNNRSLVRDIGSSELYIGEDGSSFSAVGKQAIAIRNGGGGAVPMSFNYWNNSAVTDLYLINSLNPKIAIKFTATTYDVFVNGVKILSARPISWTLSNVQFLNKNIGTTQFINQMALFPTPLTDAQCLALTA